MQRTRKLLAFILALALVALPLAGCQKGDQTPDGDVVMGRYVEETWILPLEEDNYSVNGMHKLPDGRIGMLVSVYPEYPELEEGEELDEDFEYNSETIYYTTTDGTDWQEESPPWLDELMEMSTYITSIHFNSKGEGVAVFWPKEENEEDEMMYAVTKVATLSPDGTVTVTPIGDEGTPWEDPYANMRWSGMDDGQEDEDDGEEDTDDQETAELPDDDQAEEAADTDDQAEGEAQDGGDDAEGDDDAEEDGEAEGSYGYYGSRYGSDYDGPEPLNINDLIMGEDGLVYISDYNNIGCFDPVTGEMLQDYLTWHRGFTVAGGLVVEVLTEDSAMYDESLDITEATLVYLDAATGQEVKRVPAPDIAPTQTGGRFYDNMMRLWGETDGTVYIASTAGLFRVAAEGEEVEMLLHGGMSSLSMPSFRMTAFVPHGDEFLFHYYDDGGTALINCTYAPDVPTMPEQELTIYSLVADSTLAQVVGTFRKEYPDVLVTINQASSSGEDATTSDDFIRALNTELLAGKGPDLLLLDDMPIDSYVDKGVLSDLSGLIQPMIDSGELLGSVAGALAQDGKIYAVPTRFVVPTMWGTKDALAASGSLSDLAEYWQANPDLPLFGETGDSNYATTLLTFARIYQNDFLNAEGDIDVEALERFYAACIDFVELAADERFEDYGMMKLEYMWEYRNRYYNSSAMELAYGEAELTLEILNGLESLLMPNGAMFKRGGGVAQGHSDASTTVPDDQVTEVYRLLSSSQGEVFFPSSIIGVNAAGQEELAMDFVRVMLGGSAQEYSEDSGFPVSKTALDSLFEKEGWMSMVSMSGGYDGVPERQLEGNWPSKAMLDAIRASLMELKHPVIDNRSLVEVVYGELESIVLEGATAQEAAQAVVQKSRLMLAE